MRAVGFNSLTLLVALATATPAAAEQPAVSLEGFAQQVAADGGTWKDPGLSGTMPKVPSGASSPPKESPLDAFVRENGFDVRNIPAEMRLSSPDSVMPDLCPIHGVEHVSTADLQQDRKSAFDPLAQ